MLEVMVWGLGLAAYASAAVFLMHLNGHPPAWVPIASDWLLFASPVAALIGFVLLTLLSMLRCRDGDPWVRLWIVWALAMAPPTSLGLLLFGCLKGDCL